MTLRKTTITDCTDAPTAYVPGGRPSFYFYSLTYIVLISVRIMVKAGSCSKCVGKQRLRVFQHDRMRLALCMTSIVVYPICGAAEPSSGWSSVPVIVGKLKQADEDSDRNWLAVCLACVVLLLTGGTANERRVGLVVGWLYNAMMVARHCFFCFWHHGSVYKLVAQHCPQESCQPGCRI